MSNKTELKLPFSGEWFVVWGGDTDELNYHRRAQAQTGAFDFLIHDEKGKSHKGSGTKNEDYYAFGLAVLAPADGVVVEAVQGIRDNKPGQTNLFAIGGNYLLIKHSANEYSLLAHLKQGSTLVRSGDKVKAGQKLGLCGNSGNTSEPHIHYHLQNTDVSGKFRKNELLQVAKGIKVYFTGVVVTRDGKVLHRKRYSPIKGDIVSSSIAG